MIKKPTDNKETVAAHNKMFEEESINREFFNHVEERRSKHPGVKKDKKKQKINGGFNIVRPNMRKNKLTEEKYKRIKAWKLRMKKHQLRFSS